MYNSTQINDFCDKVHKEAEEAAQKVYDSYKEEMLQRIKNQLQEDDILHIGMGTACFDDDKGKGESFLIAIAEHTQNPHICAGFEIPDKIFK
jgi:hypothetical protein